MYQLIKKQGKNWLPPALHYRISTMLGRANRYTGPFSSWAAALEKADGYNADSIFLQARDASQAVQQGDASFDRDGVAFKRPEYNFPLLCALQRVALESDGDLSVLDFGGSLGSTFFQHRTQLGGIHRLRWSVIDQPRYVEYGRQQLQSDQLVFHDNLATSLEMESPHVVLISSALHYLPNPYELLDKITGASVDYLLIDRTPLINGDENKIFVQHVPKHICPVSYPVWFLGYNLLSNYLSRDFHLLLRWDAFDGVAEGAGFRATHQGALYVRKTKA